MYGGPENEDWKIKSKLLVEKNQIVTGGVNEMPRKPANSFESAKLAIEEQRNRRRNMKE
jgi:deoxycytidylate deaminase